VPYSRSEDWRSHTYRVFYLCFSLTSLMPPLMNIVTDVNSYRKKCLKEFCFFRNNILYDVTSCSLVDLYQCFRRIYCLHLQGRNGGSWLFRKLCTNQITWHHIPEDLNINTDSRKNLKYIGFCIVKKAKLSLCLTN
jgi:hypothetical protein